MEIRNDTNKENSLYHDYLFWIAGSRDASTTAYPFVDFVGNANFALDAVVRKIYRTDGRWQYDDLNHADRPVATTDLVANQDNYTIADTHLKIARVRAKNQDGDYVTLEPKDRRDLSDDELSLSGEPRYYDKAGASLILVPTPDYDSSGGLEIEFQRGSNYFSTSDTDKEPGIPSIFHRYISLLPAQDNVLANGIPNKLQVIEAKLKEMDADLVAFFSDRDRDDRGRFETAPTLEHY